jgi:phosphate transport system substrate-binding protein
MATKFMTALTGLIMAIHANMSTPDITGVGGTAIYPVLQIWAQKYKARTGGEVNYQAIGSGAGIHQIETRTVDFANTDKPLTHGELARHGLAQFPQVMIAIVPVVHLPGIAPGRLTLDGAALSRIYLGEIKRWNDPALQALNPGLKLPDMAVLPVHRSDGSGATFNFTNYLGKVNPRWAKQVGADTAVNWPIGAAGKGNAGVAKSVQQIEGSIGYVEYAYARQARLVWTGMVNAQGARVEPGMASFQAAAANADFSKVRDFYLILTNQPGRGSWPIIAATYMLMRSDLSQAKNRNILKFLDFALHDGAADAARLDYIPLPDKVVKQVEASWATALHVSLK